LIEAGPTIREHRSAARGRLEQPTRRAETHCCHVTSSDIEGQPGRGEEPRVSGRRDVPQEPDVRLPGEALRIPGASHQEALRAPQPRGLDEQPQQCLLPVMCVSAEIRERRTRVSIYGYGAMHLRINMTVQ